MIKITMEHDGKEVSFTVADKEVLLAQFPIIEMIFKQKIYDLMDVNYMIRQDGIWRI